MPSFFLCLSNVCTVVVPVVTIREEKTLIATLAACSLFVPNIRLDVSWSRRRAEGLHENLYIARS